MASPCAVSSTRKDLDMAAACEETCCWQNDQRRPAAAVEEDVPVLEGPKCQYKSLGVLGCGQMGQALLEGILNDVSSHQFENVWVATYSSDLSHLPFIRRHKVHCTHNSQELAANCDIIVIGLRPNQCRQSLDLLARQGLLRNKLIISIVSSVTCESVASSCHGTTNRIVRAMPNTPSQVGEGATAICGLAPPADMLFVKTLMDSVGKSYSVPEHLWLGWTATAGCGPAYVFLLIEAVADALVAGGLPRDTANEIAIDTILIYSRVALKSGHVIEDMSEPTRAAYERLTQLGYQGVVMAGVQAAMERDHYLETHPDV